MEISSRRGKFGAVTWREVHPISSYLSFMVINDVPCRSRAFVKQGVTIVRWHGVNREGQCGSDRAISPDRDLDHSSPAASNPEAH